MISTFLLPVWLGYSQIAGNANLRIDEVVGRLLLPDGTPVDLTRAQLRTIVKIYG